MPIGELLFNLTDEWKRHVRKIEKLYRKLSKAQNAVIFNGHCLNEDIYIYISMIFQMSALDPTVYSMQMTQPSFFRAVMPISYKLT